jgi:peroxiredoxin
MNKMPNSYIIVFLSFVLAVFSISCNSNESSTSQTTRIERGASIEAGSKAPEIKLEDIANVPKELKQYQGKTVLLNFWATWCAPCVAEMPALERLYQKFKSRGLEIVSVSCDSPDTLEQLKSFVSSKGISFPVLHDPEIETPSLYGVTGFPESFFISPTGNFLAFDDPSTGQTSVRITADRPWDSPAFIKNVEKLLPD